jgi:heme exporter protein D
MIELGAHANFIIGAYGAAAAGVFGLIAWVLLENRRVARRLESLERQGVRRRSEAGP